MKRWFTLILVSLSCSLFAQEKGLSPLPSGNLDDAGNTFAVVVGVSDYQDAGIPDLRYADRDAEAFANFLRSPAGGALDDDHLKVLTNQNATAGRIAEALDGLLEQAGEGDQVIIYFSGHGDVERKTVSQPGFLLAWDAPSRVYMGGGTYSLSFLQEVVTTLSTQNLAKVVVITDACHAGKLSGSQIGGAQLTSTNLARQYANEVKILSCQPNEFSQEGTQWGGGRGAFSYHLVDGLFGLADRNSDGIVTVGELDRYLEDNVTAEVAPQSQVPMLLGNKTERVATVNEALLAEIKKAKNTEIPVFAATESRGLEDDILAKLDSGIINRYFAFKKAVAEKRFLPDASSPNPQPSADELYASLSAEPGLAPLHGFMKRNYAAALQDDAQQVMNKWLSTDVNEIYLSKTRKTDKYQAYPKYLERAAILLGKDHYMYPLLMARMHFFNGYLLALVSRNPDKALGEKALSAFQSALQWQPDLPHAYWQMSNVYGFNLLQPDSAEICARRAIEMQPNWILPNANISFLLSEKYKQFDRAKPFLEYANNLDSNSLQVLNSWGIFYLYQNKYALAEHYFKIAIEKDSTFAAAFNNLGNCYTDEKLFAQAELCLKKAIEIDSTNEMFYSNLGGLYHQLNRFSESEALFKKALAIDSNYTAIHFNLGNVYASTGRIAEAEVEFKKAIQIDPDYIAPMSNLAEMYNLMGRYQDASDYLFQALQIDSNAIIVNVNLANSLLFLKDYANAARIYKKVILLDSTLSSGYTGLGVVHFDQQQFAEAEILFSKAMELEGTGAGLFLNLGNAKLALGQLDEAEDFFIKTIAIDSNQIIAYSQLGNVYSYSQRFDLAEKYYDKTLQLDSTFAGAYVGKANVANATGRPIDAEKIYKMAIQSGLKSVDIFMNYGWLCQELKKFDEAAEQFKEIIRMDSSNAGAYVNLGETYQMSGKKELIEPAFKKALELNQDYAIPYALNGLGVFYLSEKRLGESEEYINRAIEMYPGFPDSYRNLGELYMKSSRKDQSMPLLEKVLSMNPEDPKVYFLLTVLAAGDLQIDRAFQAMEQALMRNYNNPEYWHLNEDLKVLQQDPRWEVLMKKYFPDRVNK